MVGMWMKLFSKIFLISSINPLQFPVLKINPQLIGHNAVSFCFTQGTNFRFFN